MEILLSDITLGYFTLCNITLSNPRQLVLIPWLIILSLKIFYHVNIQI